MYSLWALNRYLTTAILAAGTLCLLDYNRRLRQGTITK